MIFSENRYPLFPDHALAILKVLIVIQPETLVRWHGAGFRLLPADLNYADGTSKVPPTDANVRLDRIRDLLDSYIDATRAAGLGHDDLT
jgi:hypothetical protein